jgi:hypothetical protein
MDMCVTPSYNKYIIMLVRYHIIFSFTNDKKNNITNIKYQ